MSTLGASYLRHSRITRGVLTDGLVQEEVAFIQCPQLLALIGAATIDNRRDTEYVMAENEVIAFHNVYHLTKTAPDMYGRRLTQEHITQTQANSSPPVMSLLEVDAPYMRQGALYRREDLRHLCVKTYLGFTAAKGLGHTTVTTGMLGCGAFSNSISVIYLVQRCMASVVGIALRYHEGRRLAAHDSWVQEVCLELWPSHRPETRVTVIQLIDHLLRKRVRAAGTEPVRPASTSPRERQR